MCTTIRLADFFAAEPDPLATSEGSVLSHLDVAHPRFVEALTALVAPERLQGVIRVRPAQLDRHGIVLRLEYARRHRDVRLPYAAPARTVDEIRGALQALAVEADRRRRACRTLDQGGSR